MIRVVQNIIIKYQYVSIRLDAIKYLNVIFQTG
jgi:hypothetical protein